jgi:hypothetical protein
MTESIRSPEVAPDLVGEIRRVLRTSEEPLTALKLRARLPLPFRGMDVRALRDVLNRQVAANVLVLCPKYRSAQDRYWDRPVRDHVQGMLRHILGDGPRPWSAIRRRLPKYARHLADSVFNDLLARGFLHRHPPLHVRMGERFGLHPPDARTYLTPVIGEALGRLEKLGFARAELHEAALQILREGAWARPAPVLEFSYMTAEDAL